VEEIRALRESVRDTEEADKPFGPVAAAFIAAGLGVLVLGVLTTLAEASESVKDFLQFSDPVGPLSGKTILAVGTWIVAWPILHLALRKRDPSPSGVYWITGLVLVAGLIGTFPSFFESFASE
jgi:hypothetical protein